MLGIALGAAAALATGITNRNVASTLDELFDCTLGSAELLVRALANVSTVSKLALERIRGGAEARLAVPVIRERRQHKPYRLS